MRVASRVFLPVVVAAVGLAVAQDVGPRWKLGVQVKPVDTQNGPGLEVVSVTPDSPAQGAGIEPRDVILSVNGQATPAPDALLAALAGSGGRANVTLIDGNTGQVVQTALIQLVQAAPPVVQAPPQGGAPRMNQGCSFSELNAIGMQTNQLSDKSGNPFLDQVIFNHLQLISARFQVRPLVFYFEDGIHPNALATLDASRAPPDYPEQAKRFGMVLLGIRLVGDEMSRPGNHYTIAAILAHEWTHTIQFLRNCPLQGKARELHADYMSGWHIRHIKDARDQALDEGEVLARIYNHGDRDGFNSPDAHGTKTQRVMAFLEGFNSGAGSVDEAYGAGMRFVQNMK